MPQRETETLRHESELGASELVLARPQRHLRGIVERYSGYTAVKDPEGNLWDFGTYRPAAAASAMSFAGE